MSSIKNSVAGWIVVGAICVILGFAAVCWHRRVLNEPSMTLQQALWVCTADMKTYYSPGSPKSLQVIKQLRTSKGFNVKKYRTAHFLCYRMNLSEASGSSEPLLWEIDPTTLATNSVR